jgi:hypothetical protein
MQYTIEIEPESLPQSEFFAARDGSVWHLSFTALDSVAGWWRMTPLSIWIDYRINPRNWPASVCHGIPMTDALYLKMQSEKIIAPLATLAVSEYDALRLSIDQTTLGMDIDSLSRMTGSIYHELSALMAASPLVSRWVNTLSPIETE